jgi:cardiolipin synthase
MAWHAIESWWVFATTSVIFALMELAALFSAFHALRHVRTAQAAVGWTVALATLPMIALPLYWVFARHRFEGYREAIREIGERHQQSVLAIQNELQTEDFTRSTRQQSALEMLADVLDTPISVAERVELLIDGQAFFDQVFAEIGRAQRYIYLAFYIYRDDPLGRRLADALIERAQQGVQVRMLYDEVGCIRLPRAYLERLRAAGIDVHAFNTRQGWVNRFQINFRNHRKLVLIDGDVAIVGGMNIGDEYLGSSANRPPWRDTGVLVAGPITRKVQAVFAGDYYWAARQDMPEARWPHADPAGSDTPNSLTCSADLSEASSTCGNAVVCATGPVDTRPRATMMFSALANAAKQRLWISTPYLVPDDPSMVALHMAKSRGVDVRILIPNEADHWAVYLAGFHYAHALAEAKIPVFRYTRGFMHQKCVLVDDEIALIGSTNLDNRSLYLNFELMIAVQDRALVHQVLDMLVRDFDGAVESNTPEAPPRWWFERMGTAIARLFSPVL